MDFVWVGKCQDGIVPRTEDSPILAPRSIDSLNVPLLASQRATPRREPPLP